jgi:ribonuclease P protein component
MCLAGSRVRSRSLVTPPGPHEVAGQQPGATCSDNDAPDRLRCRGGTDEANISAEHSQAGEDPRVSSPHVITSRPCDLAGPPAPGTPPPGGLRPPHKVRDKATFAGLAKSTRRGRSGPVAVRFVAGEPESRVLFAYSVGRRFGGAVERNRCRRRLRAIAAEVAPGLAPGAYLIEVRPGAERYGFQELRERVFEAIQRVRTEPRS